MENMERIVPKPAHPLVITKHVTPPLDVAYHVSEATLVLNVKVMY